MSASPLRSPITSFRCADVHCFPSPYLPQHLPWLWTGHFFSEKSILFIQNFVVLKNCTVCFTRRYCSYKECTCEISSTNLVTVRGYCWRKRGRRIIFCTKGPHQINRNLYHGCTISCQVIVGPVNTLTLYVRWTYSFRQPYWYKVSAALHRQTWLVELRKYEEEVSCMWHTVPPWRIVDH